MFFVLVNLIFLICLKNVKEVINDLITNFPNKIFPKDFIDIVKKISESKERKINIKIKKI